MKRLLILINNLSEGGAQHMVYELVKNIDPSRFSFAIICYEKQLGTNLESEVEKVAEVRYMGYEGHIGISQYSSILKEISKFSPDVIHAHQGSVTFGVLWTITHRKPMVVTVHTKPERAFNKKNHCFIRLRSKLKGFRIIAVSEENAEYVKQYYKFDDSKCQYINNGIDIDRYYHEDHTGFSFINVARHDTNKNQASILRCFAKLHEEYPETRLLLLGDGPEHAALMKQTNELGIADSVVFTGNVPNTEAYYADSDAYIQASHREAMPLSVLEAMAAGLPIISTDVGGLRDVVKHNGYLIPDSDEDALLQAMKSMRILKKEDLKKLGKESRRIVQTDFSAGRMGELYMKVYDELCE